MQEGTKGKESLLLISYSFLQRQTAFDECQNQCASGITAMADKIFGIVDENDDFFCILLMRHGLIR